MASLSIEEDSGRSAPALASSSALQFLGMSRGPDKCDTESPRKKVEQAATFPDFLRIIRSVRQRLYCSLAFKKD